MGKGDYFNDARIKAMETGNYICCKCGSVMEFETDSEDTLICLNCGHSVDLDYYGIESVDDYDHMYPTEDDIN